ncbi:hypothetical protein C2G38_2162084 [Gigaspora rosea]|uniref:Uncharacterized protein n=1 Tax=Gigaspora rosea TaxID=44941 RepID=A0A397W6E7_9GLOM|nr:hypothetical protein C2G38_2162084 [Gigaspora rosea]
MKNYKVTQASNGDTVYRVSKHINLNPEKFSSRFVQHEGKKDHIVHVDDIISGDKDIWLEVVNKPVTAADKH